MEMSVYLDASMLIPLFMKEAFTERAERYCDSNLGVVVVSDFAAAEFASALARRVRTSELLTERARFAFAAFDGWTLRATQRVELRAADIRAAETFIRGLDLPLRTPDALHIAVAQRLGATLATFDEPMKKSATALGVPVAAL
jgi:predicted nucleic acid-binding protein